MNIFSTLRTPGFAGVRRALTCMNNSQPLKVQVRKMGGHNMEIRPSVYDRERMKDNLIYFVQLGAVPLGLFALYINVTRGPAELKEIPEGYVPEPHEYIKHPMKRLMAKYLINTEEKQYEITLYNLHKQNELRKSKLLNQKVKKLSKMEYNSKDWYYVPLQGTYEERLDKAQEINLRENPGVPRNV